MVHARHQTLVQDLFGAQSLAQGLFRQRGDALGLALDHGRRYLG